MSNPVQDILRKAFSSNAAIAIFSLSPGSTAPEQPDGFSTSPQSAQSVYYTGQSSLSNTLDMNENNVREVLEDGVTTCAEAEVDVIEGGRKETRKGTYLQRLYAEKLEEELEKVKEELRIAKDHILQLESQLAKSDQSRKDLELKIISCDEKLQTYIQERELLQINLDNALQKAEETSRRQGDSLGTKYFTEFPMTEIKEAAWNFDPSLKIGEGGCGSVYRGFLRHTLVAIKMMKFPSVRGSQEFQQEVDVLRKVRHPNLITLIGACPEPLILVYEYVSNGSLEDWLGSSNRAKHLLYRARIRIAMELCSVLAFLHSCKPHSIVHGDVKPGNILLDAHLVCKLSDFGICRLLSGSERSGNSTTIVHQTDPKGTFGYMDPEFLVTRELTTKCDVYSFGIILLQLLTRRPALGIAKDVQRAISAGTLGAILDPLAGEWPYMLAEELAYLALRCCEMSKRNRPDLRSGVWTVLQSIGASC
ncbi:hypothetical protein BT93_D2000 [Corymbia citriodora subsp. variegata]|nr:hypothetical protein BT93_D2000 [Corymbia citriodora subsp. variegata]